MIVPPAVLVGRAAVVGLLPGIGPAGPGGGGAVRGPGRLQRHRPGRCAHRPPGGPCRGRAHRHHRGRPWLTGLGSAAGALVLAFLALYWRRLPLLRRGFEPGTGLVRPIRRFQSGVVNDYVTWIVIGVACVGGTLAFSIR